MRPPPTMIDGITFVEVVATMEVIGFDVLKLWLISEFGLMGMEVESEMLAIVSE